ncbi:carboxylesterase/lipase family protein [Desulfatitalea alkaliphila]|uniref:Carboxylesterase family protein n=1 Tax=Desulfatitalea alkaliphila TaxID=2929485 RepID=A0AA41R210_9BACT|nr:carboxylesterase family protein [Desulfatitalea alkaliphila]MCJ8500208.1 carboxylesterase family protein [Desulfatitalea alkaliphila]
MRKSFNRSFPRGKCGIRFSVLFLGLVLIIASGCSSSSDPDPPSGGPTLSGVFLDSPVQGLSYSTRGYEGVTDEDGTFRYFKNGDAVTFSIGDFVIGTASAQEVVTPVDIVEGAVDSTNLQVTNIVRLLQTLDADGDLNNGMQITEDIAGIVSAAGQIDFNQSSENFTNDPIVMDLLADLNAANVFLDANPIPRSLKTATQALDHLEASRSDRVVVETSYGMLRGYGATDDTWQWLGVPYAQPPVGDLRWRPPQPPAPWEGVREATAWGNQAPSPPTWVVYGEGGMSEDCLYLNITAPRDAENLPVMVWLHGGGFRVLTGNTKLYNNPDSLPTKGVVLVTVNHRLGPFGYLAHPALSEESGYSGSGNYGQMDLVAALEWVQANIEAFGGNPGNVTIFGQSGGGGKVHFLLASPLATGLFHKAIVQSSRYTCPTQQITLEQAEAYGASLSAALGVDDADDVLAAMRSRSWVEIEAVSRSVPGWAELMPNVDGWYLPDTLRNIFEAGLQNDVPVLEGITQADNPHNLEVFPRELPWMADNFESDVFAFVFSRVTDAAAEQGFLTPHSGELPYVFNRSIPIIGHDPSMPIEWTDADEQIADTMMTMWTNFARTGNPGIPGEVDWQPLTSAAEEFLEIAQDGTIAMRNGLMEGFALTGVFANSPVSGLSYSTPRLVAARTDASGTFRYMPGEAVTFLVGGVPLGTAPGVDEITPVDLVPSGDISDQEVINIARLLQTLDADGDNNNGIQIPSAIHDVVASEARAIVFNQAAAAFATDPNVTELLSDLNDAEVFTDANPRARTLKPAVEARDQLVASLSDRITIETTQGALRGYGPNANTWQWLGIPYAQPPVGDLRWRPPQPLAPWTGVREATAWGNQAPQNPALRTYLDGRGAISEDCLHLNITAPRGASDLPVMVWFHGGAFTILTANTPLYNNPAGITDKDVVLVSVNHRLGALGYLAHPWLAAETVYEGSGNYGQMDLIVALEWIQENIAMFGGDPDNVTIFGQSGGGGKVVSLMMSPMAQGLFHKAISMAGQYVPDPVSTPESVKANSEALGEMLFGLLGVASIEEARALPWTAIIQAEIANDIDRGVYRPTVDDHYASKTSYDSIVDGLPSDVPFMSGCTSEDNAHLIDGLIASMPFRADHVAENQYVYKFSRGALPIVHGAELQYLFNYPSHLYTPGQDEWWTAEDREVAEATMDMWSNFAKTGDPSLAEFEWPPYTTANDTYVRIDAPLEVRTGLAEAWD